jgi:hypothetical protein
MTQVNTKTNQGYITEESHFDTLKFVFGSDNVSAPKNAGGGSDFIVIHNNDVITFESKTANTDVYDAGVINMFSNGYIYHASSFLTNTHIDQMETWVQDNIGQVMDYTLAANTISIPHQIEKDLYNQIKADKKLINIVSKDPLDNIVEHSFTKSKNRFVKANYIIVGDLIYRVSNNPDMDPLQFAAPILDESDITYTSIRTARSGAKDGKASVTLRVQFKMNKTLKETDFRLSTLKDSLNI